MTDTSAELRPGTSQMTVEQAVALARCPAEGRCWPRCQHCTAAPEEIEAARAWLDEHSGEEATWAIGKLAGIMGVLEHWTARPVEGTGDARCVVGDGARTIVDGLTQEQAEAVTWEHNSEVAAALALLNWYLGGE